jgi:hypothetical protein
MNVYDLLTEEEMADAPEDNAMAFAYLVRIAQRRLDDFTRDLSWRDDDDREHIMRARYGFMSTMLGLGRTLEVEPFKSMEVPQFEDYDYSAERQFRHDLDHCLTQLVMGNVIRDRRNSIALTTDTKERIRSHIHHIKTAIDQADVSDAKRAALHSKLADFEAALEKGRLNLFAVSRVVFEILSVSANVAGLADSTSFNRLVHNIMTTVAVAKAADDENRRLPPPDAPKAILPPRAAVPKPKPKRTTALDDFSADLDDEIPF